MECWHCAHTLKIKMSRMKKKPRAALLLATIDSAIRRADDYTIVCSCFIPYLTGKRVKSPLTTSAASVLFLKLQDETFNVGQFQMQVLTATLFFPVTWMPLQRKSIHVKIYIYFKSISTFLLPFPDLVLPF